MARKKKVVLHIGPHPSSSTGSHHALAGHRDLFHGVEHRVADVGQAELDRAAHEMLRTHRSAGLRRRDVDGAWAEICRSLLRNKSDLVLSQPDFVLADHEQVALIIGTLAGLDVHVVITPSEHEEPDCLVARWSAHLRHGRMHVASLAAQAATVDLAEELAGVALCIEKLQLDATITKLMKRRNLVRHRLALRKAS